MFFGGLLAFTWIRSAVQSMLVVMFLFSGVSVSLGTDIELIIRLRETQSGKGMEGRLQVHDGPTTDDLRVDEIKGCWFKKDLATDPVDPLKFALNSSESFVMRDVHLRLRPLKAMARSQLLLYLTRKDFYTYEFLDRGLRYHDDGELDRALAHYEAAFRESTPGTTITQFDVKLRYNYAKALCNACLSLGYDTCGRAKKLYGRLKEEARDYPMIFQSERILIRELDERLKDLAAREVIDSYADMLLAIPGNLDKAQELVNSLLTEYEQRPDVFLSVGLTKNRLKGDHRVIVDFVERHKE